MDGFFLCELPDERKAEYTAYLQSPRWKLLREQRRALDGNQCVVCGRPLIDGARFECHHITYKRLGDEWLSDLATLCPECHEMAHYIADLRKRYPLRTVAVYGLEHIMRARLNVGGVQNLLALRGEGRGYQWKSEMHSASVHRNNMGFGALFDAEQALFGKAMDYTTDFAASCFDKNIRMLGQSMACQWIIDNVPKKQCVYYDYGLTDKQWRRIKSQANCYLERLNILMANGR